MMMDKPGFRIHTRAEETGAFIQMTNTTMLHERALLADFRVCTLVCPIFPLAAAVPLNSPILRGQAILACIAAFVFISLRKGELFMPFPGLFLHS